MITLRRYLAASQRCRHAYGTNDCLTWLADWIHANGHPDPAAPYRGTYSTARGAKRLVARHNGLASIARAGALRAGLEEIDPAAAVAGDVGIGRLAETDWGDEPSGLIRAGGYWAGLTERAGVLIGRAEMLAAWRV